MTPTLFFVHGGDSAWPWSDVDLAMERSRLGHGQKGNCARTLETALRRATLSGWGDQSVSPASFDRTKICFPLFLLALMDWLLMAAEQGLQIIAGGDGGKAGYHVVGNEAFA